MRSADRIGAWLDSYRQDLRSALEHAVRDGFRVIQANTVASELDPTAFGASARRHFKNHLTNLGLRLDGLGAEFAGRGLLDPQSADERLAHLLRTLEMSAQLGVPRATVRLAGLDDPRARGLAEQLLPVIADAADRSGVQVAVHAGTEGLMTAAELLRRLRAPHVGLGVSTAALAPGAAPGLADLLADVQLRDVRRVDDQVEETPFGDGEVDFRRILGDLEAAEYRAALTVRRLSPAAGVDALRQAREYVAAQMAP